MKKHPRNKFPENEEEPSIDISKEKNYLSRSCKFPFLTNTLMTYSIGEQICEVVGERMATELTIVDFAETSGEK